MHKKDKLEEATMLALQGKLNETITPIGLSYEEGIADLETKDIMYILEDFAPMQGESVMDLMKYYAKDGEDINDTKTGDRVWARMQRLSNVEITKGIIAVYGEGFANEMDEFINNDTYMDTFKPSRVKLFSLDEEDNN